MVSGEMHGSSAQTRSTAISAYDPHLHLKAFLTVLVPLHWSNPLRFRRLPDQDMRRPLLSPNLPRRIRPTSYMGYHRFFGPRHGHL